MTIKSTKKTPVKRQTKAKTPTLNKYYNATDRNIFTATGRVRPGDTVMLTNIEALDYKGLALV